MYCPGFIIGIASVLLISGNYRESSPQLKAALLRLDQLLDEEKAIQRFLRF